MPDCDVVNCLLLPRPFRYPLIPSKKAAECNFPPQSSSMTVKTQNGKTEHGVSPYRPYSSLLPSCASRPLQSPPF